MRELFNLAGSLKDDDSSISPDEEPKEHNGLALRLGASTFFGKSNSKRGGNQDGKGEGKGKNAGQGGAAFQAKGYGLASEGKPLFLVSVMGNPYVSID